MRDIGVRHAVAFTAETYCLTAVGLSSCPGSEATMAALPVALRVTEDTTEAELLAMLHTCSRYPPSDERTRSTDTLLDLLLEWAGVDGS